MVTEDESAFPKPSGDEVNITKEGSKDKTRKLLNDLSLAMVDFKLGHERPNTEPLADLIKEFCNSAKTIQEMLNNPESCYKALVNINMVISQARICLQSRRRPPNIDFFFTHASKLIENSIPTIEIILEKSNLNQNENVHRNCFEALGFLASYDYYGNKAAYEFLGKQKKSLLEAIKTAKYPHSWISILGLFYKFLPTEQQAVLDNVISEFIENDLVSGNPGEKIASFASHLYKEGDFREGEDFVKDFLTRYGFDRTEVRKLLAAWEKSAPLLDITIPRYEQAVTLDEAAERNLLTIIQIEAQRPGGSKNLIKKFGIRCFGRYPTDLLIKQLDNIEDQRPYGVILAPESDRNGTFYKTDILLTQLLSQLEELGDEYNLRAFEARSKFDIARALLKLKRWYQPKISFAFIGGHGTENSIQFGNKRRDINDLLAEDLKGRGVQRTSEFFVPNPTIILNSCSTAADEGIGEKLSEMIGAEVLALKTSSAIISITVNKKDGRLYFKIEGKKKGDIRAIKGNKKQ